MEKKQITIGIGIIIALLLVSLASAEFLACFQKGEVMDYCDYTEIEGSNYTYSHADETCDRNSGCEKCMRFYDEDYTCYVHGRLPYCNLLPRKCADMNTTTVIDVEPPEFNLIKPVDGDLFTSRRVLIEFSLNEKADVSYMDLDKGVWRTLCSNCLPGNPSYSKERSFNEGENNLQFKAVDVVGNTAYQNVNFFIDSKAPRIYRTEPRRGFTDGNFEVQFGEDNPESLILYYGEDEKELNIEDCDLERGKYYCNTNVELDGYDGEEIKYYFELEDIAGNIVESRAYSLDVDTTDPVINNKDSFWTQGEGRYNKYIYFNIDITEENLDEVFYSYIDSRDRLREKRLCSKLKDGICEKKVSFGKGHYDLTVGVVDEAGNPTGEGFSFDVV